MSFLQKNAKKIFKLKNLYEKFFFFKIVRAIGKNEKKLRKLILHILVKK